MQGSKEGLLWCDSNLTRIAIARYSKAVDKLCLAVLGGSGDMYLATTEGLKDIEATAR